MTLPNNPEVKNPARLIFGEPPLHAFVYMGTQLRWLIKFCHEITFALTDPPTGEKRAVSSAIVFRSPIQLGAGARLSGHHLVGVEEVRADIEKLVSTFKRL